VAAGQPDASRLDAARAFAQETAARVTGGAAATV
jgi:hypothetical protein